MRNGVCETGNAAQKDSSGLYWFHGRFDDIIKRDGFRIGSYEIENVLNRHQAVIECCVISTPDPLRVQAVKAVIVPADGFSPSHEFEKDIREFCNSKPAKYKWI